MKRKKKMSLIEKVFWLKLSVGLALAVLFFVAMAWSSVTAPTMEEAVQNMVQFGVLAGICLWLAVMPACGGCLG